MASETARATVIRPDEITGVPLLDLHRENKPLSEEFQHAMHQVCETGRFVLGPECEQLEQEIAAYCGAKHAVGCASGSDALLLALLALEIGPGDEVILPSFTFFATASAVTRLGATPVFADIDAHTMNVDPQDVARRITPATKAIIPVHLFGQCAEMKTLRELADSSGVSIVEDAAQAIGAIYAGQRAGSLGTVGCFSFYPTKNLGGFGDGGMMTTSDDALADRLRLLRTHGMRPRYHHEVVGINSRLDSLQATVLLIKLKQLDAWTAQRQRNALRYRGLIEQGPLAECVTCPTVDLDCDSVWNQFTLRVQGGRRDALRGFLQERNIGTEIYYPIPLHLQPCFAYLGCGWGSLPVTERAAQEVLSLPIFPGLRDAEQTYVVEALEEYFGVSAARARTVPMAPLNRRAA